MNQEVKPSQIAQLTMENSILRDLLQNRMPMGCIAETTYQPILDENENLKHERDFYIQRLKDVSSENTCPIIKKLKEENEKVKKIYKLVDQREEVKKLKEENAKLKEDSNNHLGRIVQLWNKLAELGHDDVNLTDEELTDED